MGYKISGMTTENARIIIVKESDWSIEKNQEVSNGGYDITGLTNDSKTIIARAANGHSIGYGNVTPEFYTSVPTIPFTDEFTQIDSNTWDSFVNGENGSATIENNKLRLWANGTTSVRMSFKYKLSGDFDIQVDYSTVLTPDTLGWYFALSLSYDSTKWAQIARTRNEYGNIMYHDRGNPWAGGNTAPPINTGKLRVTRVGSLNTWLYWNGSSWSTIASAAGWDSGPCTVRLYNTYAGGSPPERTVDFDNFTINSGTLIEI